MGAWPGLKTIYTHEIHSNDNNNNINERAKRLRRQHSFAPLDEREIFGLRVCDLLRIIIIHVRKQWTLKMIGAWHLDNCLQTLYLIISGDSNLGRREMASIGFIVHPSSVVGMRQTWDVRHTLTHAVCVFDKLTQTRIYSKQQAPNSNQSMSVADQQPSSSIKRKRTLRAVAIMPWNREYSFRIVLW